MATAEFSKFAGILSAALSQHHLSEFERAQLEFPDSILKSRDMTLPTKVHLVEATVFPVVMDGCESWTIKTAEHQRIDAFNCGVGEDS